MPYSVGDRVRGNDRIDIGHRGLEGVVRHVESGDPDYLVTVDWGDNRNGTYFQYRLDLITEPATPNPTPPAALPLVRQMREGDRVQINETASRGYRGEIGTLVRVHYESSTEKLWVISMDNGAEWRFYERSLSVIDTPTPTPVEVRAPGEFRVGDRVRVNQSTQRSRSWVGAEGTVNDVLSEYSAVSGRSTIRVAFDTSRGSGTESYRWLPSSLDLIDATTSTAPAPPAPALPPIRRTREEVNARLEQYRSAPASGLSRLAIEELEWILS